MNNNLIEIISKFVKVKNIANITKFDSGHINDTYLIKTDDLNHSRFVLQKINHNIFQMILSHSTMCISNSGLWNKFMYFI